MNYWGHSEETRTLRRVLSWDLGMVVRNRSEIYWIGKIGRTWWIKDEVSGKVSWILWTGPLGYGSDIHWEKQNMRIKMWAFLEKVYLGSLIDKEKVQRTGIWVWSSRVRSAIMKQIWNLSYWLKLWCFNGHWHFAHRCPGILFAISVF